MKTKRQILFLVSLIALIAWQFFNPLHLQGYPKEGVLVTANPWLRYPVEVFPGQTSVWQ